MFIKKIFKWTFKHLFPDLFLTFYLYWWVGRGILIFLDPGVSNILLQL